MIINRSTVNDYINGKHIDKWSNQWVYHAILDNKYLIENVSENKKDFIKNAVDILENELKDFKPYNIDIWENIFSNWQEIVSNSIVYLVVGCPRPYDAMVRTSPDGKEVIILDVNRMLSYADSIDELISIIKNLLTHEFAHTCLHSDYPVPDENASFEVRLKNTCFDEGMAHFLSFNENIKSINWMEEKLIEKKKRAYDMLIYAINSKEEVHSELLIKSNSGQFWDKFGAISGMFAIVDMIIENEYDYDIVSEIYKKGPEKFLSSIFENK